MKKKLPNKRRFIYCSCVCAYFFFSLPHHAPVHTFDSHAAGALNGRSSARSSALNKEEGDSSCGSGEEDEGVPPTSPHPILKDDKKK